MISVVVPVYNEKDSLALLYGEIADVAGQAGLDVEVLFVDDGSTDGSWGIIRDLAANVTSPNVEIERTSECFGACHRAPMARVGEEYREGLVGEARQQLIDELKGL